MSSIGRVAPRPSAQSIRGSYEALPLPELPVVLGGRPITHRVRGGSEDVVEGVRRDAFDMAGLRAALDSPPRLVREETSTERQYREITRRRNAVFDRLDELPEVSSRIFSARRITQFCKHLEREFNPRTETSWSCTSKKKQPRADREWRLFRGLSNDF